MSQVLEYLDSEAEKRDAIKLGPRALPLEELLDGIDSDEIGEFGSPEDKDTGDARHSSTFRQLADELSPKVLGVTTAAPHHLGHTQSARNVSGPEQTEPLQKQVKSSDDDATVDKPVGREISPRLDPKTAERVDTPKDVSQDGDPSTNKGPKAQAALPRRTITPASIRSDPSRHLGHGVDFSALPKATRESSDKSSRIVRTCLFLYAIKDLTDPGRVGGRRLPIRDSKALLQAGDQREKPQCPPPSFPRRGVCRLGYPAVASAVPAQAYRAQGGDFRVYGDQGQDLEPCECA
jgi:hypothetical protein